MNISFLGLGIMGSRMAANLLKNDIAVTVYNRSSTAVENLVAQGAIKANTVEAAVSKADLVFTMLSTPAAVSEVMLAEQGGITKMKAGAIWSDCSTVNPSFTLQAQQKAAAHGVHFIDSPVAGTKPHAANAELVFFVGGAKEQVEQVKPYYEMMGKKTLHLGAVGKGASFKMLVNIMLAQSMVVFSEAVLLGEKMGFGKDFLLNALPNLVVAAPFTKFKAEMIRANDYEVQFPLEWMYKDLHLATQTAYELSQPLYLANITKELFAEANKNGKGRLDFAAIHQYLESK